MSSQYSRTGFEASTLLPLLLSCAALLVAALVGPVSGQEIVIKSMNLNQAGGSVVDPTANSLQPQPQRPTHQPQQQQQQQQQQRVQYKSNPQDAHLKSLTVYATNYDSISSNNDQSNNNNNINKLAAFKPSYNYNSINHNNNKRPLFEFQTQFTPLQAQGAGVTLAGPATHPAQPVIMQYLPQTVHQAGVQYLQLIPTRPLIVPIGHYLQAANAGTAQVSADVVHNNNNNHIYHQPPAPALTTNTITDYNVHAPALLNSVPVNVAPPAPAPAPIMEIPAASTLPYGLPTYAQGLQPYRSYRFNREIKPRSLPSLLPSVNLNMYEYLPAVHESLTTYGRGKP